MVKVKGNIRDPKCKDSQEPPLAVHLVLDFVARQKGTPSDVDRTIEVPSKLVTEYNKRVAAKNANRLDFALYCKKLAAKNAASDSVTSPCTNEGLSLALSFLSHFITSLKCPVLSDEQAVAIRSLMNERSQYHEIIESLRLTLAEHGLVKQTISHVVSLLVTVGVVVGIDSTDTLASILHHRFPLLPAPASEEEANRDVVFYGILLKKRQRLFDVFECRRCQTSLARDEVEVDFHVQCALFGYRMPPLLHFLMKKFLTIEKKSEGIGRKTGNITVRTRLLELYKESGLKEYEEQLDKEKTEDGNFLVSTIKHLLKERPTSLLPFAKIPRKEDKFSEADISSIFENLSLTQKYILGHLLVVLKVIMESKETKMNASNLSTCMHNTVVNDCPTPSSLAEQWDSELVSKFFTAVLGIIEKGGNFLNDYQTCSMCEQPSE